MESNDQPYDDEDTMAMLESNLPSGAFSTSTPNERLKMATQESERTKKITPILKEELRSRILMRRHEQGAPELETAPEEPKHYELTEEEKQKRERRKAQNRKAAKKCREKRKLKNVSDAERHNILQEENQRLRNDKIFLQEKLKTMQEYCFSHIITGQCPLVPNDTSSQQMLSSLLGNQQLTCMSGIRGLSTQCSAPTHSRTSLTSTPPAPSTIPQHQTHYNPAVVQQSFISTSASPQCYPTTSGSLQGYSTTSVILESFSTTSGVVQSFTSTPAISEVFHTTSVDLDSFPITSAPQQVALNANLQEDAPMPELNPQDVSSWLPKEPVLDISDHSAESTPPNLSPTGLFSTMSPISSSGVVAPAAVTANSSFFNDTPSTSFSSQEQSEQSHQSSTSGENNISSINHSNHSSFQDNSFKTDCISVVIKDGKCFTNNQLSSHFLWTSSDSFTTDSSNSDAGNRSSAESYIVNTALLEDLPIHTMEALLNNCTPAEYELNQQNFPIENHRGNKIRNQTYYNGDSEAQTVPTSPLTPLSPSSPSNIIIPPTSPAPLVLDITPNQHYVDLTTPTTSSTVRVQHSTAEIPVPRSPNGSSSSTLSKPATPARPIVRRTSSTASASSPFVNQYLSSSLSPPPSVPSPSNHGIFPESPSILTGFQACDENPYFPMFSPVSSTSSTQPSPVRLQDFSEDEFNN